MIRPDPTLLLHDWFEAAKQHSPRPWRQRRHLRATMTEEHVAAVEDIGDPELVQQVDRLWNHPYYTFEPRDDEPGVDEQTSFIESDSFVTVAVGGNGSGKTFTAAQKCLQFLSETPAPKRDTPFWVIANTLEMSCKSCWAQKLSDLIPPEWVAWSRIVWFREKLNWPLIVPLVPIGRQRGAGLRNWMLCFKSYEQGREQMQAESIGGAWFSEQFPYEIFTEVLRGCREHDEARIWMEFTPIDPQRSVEMEEAEDKKLAGDEEFVDWSFHRLNTESAEKAGHVTQRWLRTFRANLSEVEASVRIAGHYASFKGQIYPGFAKRIHCTTKITIPTAHVSQLRGIDWGAGEENAFCCLWAFRDSVGAYWVYDEYYTTDQTHTWAYHAQQLRERMPWPRHDPRYGNTYAPGDRPDLIRQFGGEYSVPIVRAYGGPYSVYEGIECIRKLLEPNRFTGEPRIMIDEDKCPNLVRQMRTYRWKQSSDAGVNPEDARPEPLKKDDHAVDALRYLITSDYRSIGGAIGRDRIVPGSRERYGITSRPRS